MTQPKLAVASSGLGGRGYVQLFGDRSIVPSITTALGAVGDPSGLIHWHVMQTALFSVTHIDDLLNRTEEAGVRYLQYVTKKQKPEVLDSDDLNVFTAARVVLDDLGVEARVEYDTGNGSLNVDGRFERVSGDRDEGVYETPGYEAAGGLAIRLDSGNGSVTITTP